jgi:RecA-family ATPase
MGTVDSWQFKIMETFSPLVEPVSKLVPGSVTWLWPGRLARGKLSIIDGDPEIGKSLITLDLCARITTGRCFPDGAAAVPPSNVLVMSFWARD